MRNWKVIEYKSDLLCSILLLPVFFEMFTKEKLIWDSDITEILEVLQVDRPYVYIMAVINAKLEFGLMYFQFCYKRKHSLALLSHFIQHVHCYDFMWRMWVTDSVLQNV